MTTVTLSARAYRGESDIAAICALLNTCDALDQQDDNYSVEDLRLEFSDPRIDQACDLRVWQDSEGQLVGFGEVWRMRMEETEAAEGFLYFRVLPEARGGEIEEAIMAWGSERMVEVGRTLGLPARLRSGAREEDSERRAFLERQGLVPDRYFFRMVRSLDEPIPEPQFPIGITLQHTAGIVDGERWVAAYNQSFIDHWNHHPATIELHQHHLSDPNYRPEHDLVAVTEDGVFAAFCFCSVNAEDNARNSRREGWIALLGTQRGYRKIGLGRAMLLAGLHQLKADGLDTAKLGVDAQNPTGALQLYESVGFRKAYTSISYVKSLDTGASL